MNSQPQDSSLRLLASAICSKYIGTRDMPDLIDRPDYPASERFRLMADLIDRNATSTFGGAVVIIPPSEGGDPIEMLMLDVTADAGQFWATIKTRIEIKLNQMDEKARAQATFGHPSLRR